MELCFFFGLFFVFFCGGGGGDGGEGQLTASFTCRCG